MAPEVCENLEGVVFDVDDTVTRDGRLELEAYSAMHDLKAGGLRLVCVTGRPLGWADVFARLWPVDLAVGENGAGWVWRDGLGLKEGYFDNAEAREEQAEVLARIRARVALEMPDVGVAGDQRARRCDLAFDIGETVAVSAEVIDQLIALIGDEGARSAASSVHAHAIPGRWDKALGSVRAMREALGVELDRERDRWLFIGDSGNDAAAFAFFPNSVGVANVASHLERMPDRPRFVTVEDRGRGFAEMARFVLTNR